jgi:hypothetical protein
MLRLAKVLLLATAAVLGFTSQKASGVALPDALDVVQPFPQFGVSKHQAGADGNVRLIWDYISISAYQGSVLWILNSQGQIVATGDTKIPASIGVGMNPFLPTSNIAMHVQPSGNVTLVFAHVIAFATTTTPALVDSFSTWTYNAQGKLIAFGGPYGPFGNAALSNLEFKRDTLIAHWTYGGPTYNGLGGGLNALPEVVWSLDEFGKIQTTAGPFGPFPGTTVMGVDVGQVNGSPVQIWEWYTQTPPFAVGLRTWTIDQTGNIIASSNYGPF